MALDLVVLGNLIVDDIVHQDGTTEMGQAGGAALYMGLTAHLWGLSIGIVSVVGTDFPVAMLESMTELDVDLAGVRTLDRPGLRTWLLYENDIRRVVHHLDGASHRTASPVVADIPSAWNPRAVHLAPMPFDLHRQQITDLRARFGGEVLLSLDPFELLNEERLDGWRDLLESVDILFLSTDEIPSVAARDRPEPLLRGLQRERPTTVFLKQGAGGGLVSRDGARSTVRWPARAQRVVDTTGAGDAFACGVLAGLLAGRSLERSVGQGVVSASFAIQDRGTDGLRAATPELARDRLHRWFGVPETTPQGSARSGSNS